MAKIRLTKEFAFEAAHALDGYDGACRNIHGHSYRLFVTVCGTPSEDPADPKRGMVTDFGVLKRIVNSEIVDRLDHSFIVEQDTLPPSFLCEIRRLYGNVAEVPYRPTCENMLVDFARRLLSALPPSAELYSLRLHETATSYAEWFASDNR